jgi:hypothetical protein
VDEWTCLAARKRIPTKMVRREEEIGGFWMWMSAERILESAMLEPAWWEMAGRNAKGGVRGPRLARKIGQAWKKSGAKSGREARKG